MADLQPIIALYANRVLIDAQNRAAAAGARGVAQEIQALTKAWTRAISQRKGLIEAHQKVARRAQKDMVGYYRKVNAASLRRGAGPYRSNESDPRFKRYAGGALLAAISDPSIVIADRQGVGFNMTAVSAVAPQWARINWGAGSRGSGLAPGAQRSRPTVRLFGGALTVGRDITEQGPRPSYRIPRGVFIRDSKIVSPGTGRTDEYMPLAYLRSRGESQRNALKLTSRQRVFPSRRARGVDLGDEETEPSAKLPVQKARMSAGFGGYHFLDLGVARIARYASKEWEVLMREWLTARVQDRTIKVGITPGLAESILRSL